MQIMVRTTIDITEGNWKRTELAKFSHSNLNSRVIPLSVFTRTFLYATESLAQLMNRCVLTIYRPVLSIILINVLTQITDHCICQNYCKFSSHSSLSL